MEIQLPEDVEEVEDEAGAIRAERAVAHKDGDEGMIRDFNLAARIAREDSVAALPEFAGALDVGYDGRKFNAIFAQKLAAAETESGRKATPAQRDKMWNAAGLEAMGQEAHGPGKRFRRSRRS